MASHGTTDNRERILEVALRLAQTQGFNAFSYRDLAEEIGIKTSSIHYYFPSKEALGTALLVDYTSAVQAVLKGIRATRASPRVQFQEFVAIFHATAKTGERLCLAGMMASDLSTLSPSMQQEVRRFFELTEAWVAELLASGRASGAFAFKADPKLLAGVIVSALEGGLISARVHAEPGRVEKMGHQLEALFLGA